MSCCGRQRAAMAAQPTGGIEESEPVWLSYAGVRAIVVKGPATGHVYRFVPGRWLRVHGSDAGSMREIPGLKKREVHP
jgi:hypothetical protein